MASDLSAFEPACRETGTPVINQTLHVLIALLCVFFCVCGCECVRWWLWVCLVVHVVCVCMCVWVFSSMILCGVRGGGVKVFGR